jgi:PPM family protein phosphatase
MNPLNQLTRGINSFSRTLGSPFRQLRRLTRSNPLTRTFRTSRSSFRQLGHALRRPFRSMGRTFGRLGGKNKFFKGFTGSFSESLPSREGKKAKDAEAILIPQKTELSQIHLVHQKTQNRTIIHIGSTIGESVVEINLEKGKHKPVRVRFSQVDPDKYDSPLLLTHIAGRVPIRVDGNKPLRNVSIHPQSRIIIDRDEYVCELYNWGQIPITPQIDVGWATDVGNVRPHNEDAIGIARHTNAEIFALADGVGGGEAGDVVSEFAIQYLLTVFNKNIKYSNLLWQDIYEKAYAHINAEVRNFASQYAFTTGTTLTAVVIKEWDAHIGHIGDSRLYYWRMGQLQQMTTDHCKEVSLVRDTIQANEASEDEPKRDILVRAIGKSDSAFPDVSIIRLQPRDKLLLCSDGVTDQISDDELGDLIASTPIKELPEHLIQLANERGGNDNATAIAIDILPITQSQSNWRAKSEDRISVGYDRSWSLRLKPPKETHTDHAVKSKLTPYLWLAIFVLVILLAISVSTSWLEGKNNQKTVIAPQVTLVSPTPTPTATVTATLSPSATPTATFAPSATPTVVVTPESASSSGPVSISQHLLTIKSLTNEMGGTIDG